MWLFFALSPLCFQICINVRLSQEPVVRHSIRVFKPRFLFWMIHSFWNSLSNRAQWSTILGILSQRIFVRRTLLRFFTLGNFKQRKITSETNADSPKYHKVSFLWCFIYGDIAITSILKNVVQTIRAFGGLVHGGVLTAPKRVTRENASWYWVNSKYESTGG